MTQTAVSQKSLTHAKRQAKTLDIGTLLKRHGSWYGSAKTRMQEQWLISFWNGMLLSTQDVQVEHATLSEPWTQRLLLSWQMWTTAAVQEELSFTGRYQTIEPSPIRLRQFQTEGGLTVYLMENLCTYLPTKCSFFYVPAHRNVVVRDQIDRPYAVFKEFVPQIAIRPVGKK